MQSTIPNKRDFLNLAKKGNVVSVYREILADLETPVSCFLKLGDSPYSYLLESVEGGEKQGRYSFIGGAPKLVFKSHGKKITLISRGGHEKVFQTKKDVV